MRPVGSWACATPEPSHAMPGPTASSSGCRARSCKSTGASPSDGRYFTGRPALQRSLTEFMRYYNDERPHQGYRLRGRTPSTLVWGAGTLWDSRSVNTVSNLDTLVAAVPIDNVGQGASVQIGAHIVAEQLETTML